MGATTNVNYDGFTNTSGSYDYGTREWNTPMSFSGSGTASGPQGSALWGPSSGGASVTLTGIDDSGNTWSYPATSFIPSFSSEDGGNFAGPYVGEGETRNIYADGPGGTLVDLWGVDLPGGPAVPAVNAPDVYFAYYYVTPTLPDSVMGSPAASSLVGMGDSPASIGGLWGLTANAPSVGLPSGAWGSGAPTLPDETMIGSPPAPTLPADTAVTSLPNSTASLAGLARPPILVSAMWGMDFTADTAPQTLFAAGNTAGASATFTSEKMRGADAAMGGNIVAPVFPVTDSPLLVHYALNGVSAGNPAWGGVVSSSVSQSENAVGLAAVTSGSDTDASANLASLGSQSLPSTSGVPAYDSQGNLASLTSADGGVTQFGYDASRNLTSLTDPDGNTTDWSYNSQNNVTQETNALGNSASLVYNSSNQLASYTDMDGNVRTYQYDTAGHVITETLYATTADADAGQNAEDTLQYAYDSSGNLISESDDDSSDTYTYDSKNRLTSVTEASVDSPTVVLTYQYAATGTQPTSVAATIDGVADYQDAYTYNSLGQLTVITRTAASSAGDAVADETVDLTYNAAGQMQTIDRYQGGQLAVEADYAYDSSGRLVSLVYEQGTTVLASYSYSYAASAAAGETVSATASSPLPSGEGQGVRASWLPGGAMLPATSTQGINAAGLDQAVSPEQIIAGVTSLDGSVAYSYDAEGQLTAANYSPLPSGEGQGEGGSAQGQPQPNESYSYDANGNRTSSTSSAAVVIGANNEVLFDGTYTYSYDADGNETAKFIDVNHTGVLQSGDTDVTQYTWDADNRLVQVTTSAT